ncbi:copper resistance CopC/CopD family protein [Streptomyces sp. NPDC050433]|uniref:copper resistance CopC/CopD family protein n=1 Tax=Streptomyces sp. NPDC050433 TaxID=3365615 RepID=UPI0037AF7A7E
MTLRRSGVPVLALIAVLLCAPAASAHTDFTSSSPGNGAVLAPSVHSVRLNFSEPVGPDDVRVTADGERLTVTRPDARHPRTVSVALPTARTGRLSLVWRVVSEQDGHGSTGKVSYRIRAASDDSDESAGSAGSTGSTERAGEQAEEEAVPQPSSSLRNAVAVARWTEYLALALFVGGLGFLLLLWPQGAEDRRARTVLALAWACGCLATVAATGLQAVYATMGSFGDVLRASTYGDVLATDAGVASAARVLLWVLATVVLTAVLHGGERTARSPGWRIGAITVCLGLLYTFGMNSHSGEGSHPGWGAVADLVHLLGISLWIGGLVLLVVGVLPRRRPDELAAVVPGYSVLAGASVAAIAVAGVVLSWQVLGSFGALFDTHHGRLLLIKLALLAAVLLIAQRSRSWVRTRLDIAVLLRGDRATVRPFVYSVAAETGLVLAVLAAASVLVTASPGR